LSLERPLQVNNHRFFRKARYGADKFVLVHQDKIHYVEAGQGEPLLLVPGSQSGFRIWNHLMPLLETQYRLLALDNLAIEDNSNPQKTVEAIHQRADLIAAMLKQMKLDKVNLISGHLGSAVALNLAARYPDLIERVAAISGYISPPAELIKPLPRTPKKTEKPVINQLEEEAKAIKCPILYLYGTKTNPRELPLAHNLEYLQKNHPQAWIVALEGGIFEIALKNPQEISALFLDFLKFKPGLRIG
jgi:pimeloyl-ACP methyl ester carboxylesterase